MNAMRLGLALAVALLIGGCTGVGSTSATRQRPSPTASAAQSGIGHTECVETPRQIGGRFAGHPAWIQADPSTSGLYAILLYGNLPLYADGKEPNGAAPKIIWLADPTIGGHTLARAFAQGGETDA